MLNCRKNDIVWQSLERSHPSTYTQTTYCTRNVISCSRALEKLFLHTFYLLICEKSIRKDDHFCDINCHSKRVIYIGIQCLYSQSWFTGRLVSPIYKAISHLLLSQRHIVFFCLGNIQLCTLISR